MENYPGNSNKGKTPDEADPNVKKIEKIEGLGEVIQRKKPLGKRFSETFLGGDARGVATYVVFDILVPAAKDMMADAVSQGFERMIFGETRSSGRRSSSRSRGPGGPNGYVSYNRFSSPNSASHREREDRTMSRRARENHDFDEILLATRAEAEEVIDRMIDVISRYDTVTVSDLYEMVGITSSYTDGKWGWSDLQGAGVSRTSNGYLLNLPKTHAVE